MWEFDTYPGDHDTQMEDSPRGYDRETSRLRREYLDYGVRDVECVKTGGRLVVGAHADIREAAGETVGHALLVAIRPEDGAEATPAGEVCDAAEAVLDPRGTLAGWIGEGVRRTVAHALLIIGPVGIGIAFLTGRLAEDLFEQALGPDEDVEHHAKAIDWINAGAGVRLGRLPESGPFREHLEESLRDHIHAMLDSTGTVPAEPPQLQAYVLFVPTHGAEADTPLSETSPGSGTGEGAIVMLMAPRAWVWADSGGNATCELRLRDDGVLFERWFCPPYAWETVAALETTDQDIVETWIRRCYDHLRRAGQELYRV